MNSDEFFKAREELASACLGVLESKGKDYAGDGDDKDRLANFKVVAMLLKMFNVDQSTPEGTWCTYFLKHVFAILAFMGQRTESEPILGRFVDARNYLDLGYALVTEGQYTEPEPRLTLCSHPEDVRGAVVGHNGETEGAVCWDCGTVVPV